VVRAGITAGGDTLSSFNMSNGMKREITAGGLEQAGLGTRYQFGELPLSLELGINYQLDRDYNENDKASFRRVPLEGIVFINLPGNFRIGGGARHIYSTKADSAVDGASETIRFRNARGSIVELGYHVAPYGWVALRYVRENYVVESYSTTSATAPPLPVGTVFDGAHVGAFLVFEN
jgi:hypothetical protein